MRAPPGRSADSSASISSSSRNGPQRAGTAERSAVAVDDPRAVEVVGRELDANAVTREDADPKPAHLARDVPEHAPITVVVLVAVQCVWVRLGELYSMTYIIF